MTPQLRPKEKLVVFQAFIDDSMDESGLFVLGGYVASEEQWAAFSNEWERMLPRSSLQTDGRYRFKMSEMALSPERMSRVSGFHNIINRHVAMSVACIVDSKLLNKCLDDLVLEVNHRQAGAQWTETVDISALKAQWRDPFYMAYRALMDTFHMVRVEQPELVPVDEVIDFYFDETTRKATVLQQWEDYVSRRPEAYKTSYGSVPRFEDDEVFLPLQAADFRAWWTRKWALELGVENIANGGYPFAVANLPIYNLVLSIQDERQLKQILAEALGEASVELIEGRQRQWR